MGGSDAVGDCRQRGFRLGAVGAAGLGKLWPAAAAFAAKRLGAGAHKLDGVEAHGGKGGGGRPEFAQAGCPDGAKAETALAAIVDRIGAAQAGEPALSAGSA